MSKAEALKTVVKIANQSKLNKLQEKHSALTRVKIKAKRGMADKMKEITKINKELKMLGCQIFDLRNIDGDTPHITDHAIVRYLERVEGRDIWELKAKIVEYKDSVRIENTIVTVNNPTGEESAKDDN